MDALLNLPRTHEITLEVKNRKKKAGFTLIEVMIAMAIFSFSFIGIMGMMSTGLYLFHQGTNLTTSTEIAQQVINSVQQTSYSQLSGLEGQMYYYDDQGNLLTTGNQSQAVFQAHVTVNSSVQLPGSTLTNPNLAVATVQVAYNPGNLAVNWTGTTPGVSLVNYTTVVSNVN